MANKVGKAEKDANLTWTDEETALLMQVVIDYKIIDFFRPFKGTVDSSNFY